MKRKFDQLVVDKGFAESLKEAQALIMAGQVFVDGRVVDKAGTLISDEAEVIIKEFFPYVSRGALKIEKAFQAFRLDFKDKIICDIGSSTGGFTDFALQHGAKQVYAIDVGHGQLDQKLREDNRVIVMERTDFRNVGKLPGGVDYFLCDVSFISLKKILPHTQELIANPPTQDSYGRAGSQGRKASIIALIKPQFEASAKEVTQGKGVIKSEQTRQEITEEIKKFAQDLGFEVQGLVESPIKGAKGNVEYLLYLTI